MGIGDDRPRTDHPRCPEGHRLAVIDPQHHPGARADRTKLLAGASDLDDPELVVAALLPFLIRFRHVIADVPGGAADDADDGLEVGNCAEAEIVETDVSTYELRSCGVTGLRYVARKRAFGRSRQGAFCVGGSEASVG